METPAAVQIHNDQLGLKGAKGVLLYVSPDGFYEANLSFGDKQHRVLLPISHTVVISQEPEELGPPTVEVER